MNIVIHNLFYDILSKKRTLSFKTYADAEKRVIKKQFDVTVNFKHTEIYNRTHFLYYNTSSVIKYNAFCININTNSLECYTLRTDIFNLSFTSDVSGIRIASHASQHIKYGKIHSYFKEFFIKNYINSTKKEFNESISDEVFQNKLIESISEDIKAGFIYPYELKISEFPEMVYETCHHPKSGTLCNSCMRVESSHNCRHYSAAYNGICKILYAQDDENLLLGRALIWENCIESQDLSEYIETKRISNPCTFLDRAYGDNLFQFAALNYARQQGWKYRYFESNTIFSSGSNVSDCIYKVCPQLPDYLINKGTPYFDTLKYYNPEHKLITNESSISKDIVKLISIGNSSGSTISSLYFYTYRCSYCEKGYESEGNEIGHQHKLCRHCADTYLKTCDCCGKINTSMKYDSKLNIHYCNDRCLNSLGYIQCSDCLEIIKINNANGVKIDRDIHIMCESCIKHYYKCKICNNYTYHNNNICSVCSKFLNVCGCCKHLFVKYSNEEICTKCMKAYTKSYETYQFYLDIENLE